MKYGGILFRGFGIDSIDTFNSMMQIYRESSVDYVFRSSPRHSLADRVYESTTYPADRQINMHSEQSYSYALIQKIVFCCLKKAEERGETPIVNNRKILSSLSEELRNKFYEKGVLYQRNLSPYIGMGWEEVFQTDSREEVIKNCEENNISYEFDDEEDSLILRWKKDAIINHPVSNEATWFNHCFFFNKYSMFEEMGIDPEDGLPEESISYNTFFGDGSEITFEEYTEIRNAYHDQKVMFPWEEGDVLFLDNILTSHGRSPFKGERQIVVSMV